MKNIFIPTGPSAYDPSSAPISAESFGVKYVSYRNIFRFLDQTNDLNTGMITWPGGALAEQHTDRFGFQFDGLYNPATGKPGLSEMMSLAVSKGASLSVILPTARYEGHDAALRADVHDFMQDLLSGHYGQIPDRLILEVGNEYHANFAAPDSATAAAHYAQVANTMITEIGQALADPTLNAGQANIAVAVQSGLTLADDDIIRGTLNDYARSHIDLIVQHRFPAVIDQVDDRLHDVDAIVKAWEADAAAHSHAAPDLFLSEWNVGNLTRTDVLQHYLATPEAQQAGLTAADIDLAGRTTTAFEQYWQQALDANDYGPEQPALLLETFARYTDVGMDAASVYGFDVMHPSHLSWQGNDGVGHRFVGGELLDMLYESVGDTHLVDPDTVASNFDTATPYIFENDDKLVVFLATGQHGDGTYKLDIQGLGTVYDKVWAESLSSQVPSDWMTTYGIIDNPNVDETPESETYAEAVRTPVTPKIVADGVKVRVDHPHDVIRLAFSKTAAGEQDIDSWSHVAGVPLLDPSQQPDPHGPGADVTLDEENDVPLDGASLDVGMLLLAALLAFL